VDVFPIHPESRYDYAERFSKEKGGHKGTDIFAEKGTPVVAVESGLAHADHDRLGGIVIYLLTEAGTKYYYAHLDGVVNPLDPDTPDELVSVEPGDIIGFVGNTGNAATTPPHLHFQISEPGVGVVNPFPELVAVDPTAPDRVFSEGRFAGFGGALLVFAILWLLGGKRRG
jgi:murein DD-endopeptidase MepM/ murein hydrolase activator NlpD